MRRRLPIPRIVISLVLGVVTTIAVAWAVALRGIDANQVPVANPTVLLVDAEREIAWYFGPPHHGIGWTLLGSSIGDVSAITPTAVRAGGRAGLFPDDGRFWYTRVYTVPDHRRLPPNPSSTRQEFRFGWPFRALWAATDTWPPDYNGTVIHEHVHSVPIQGCHPANASPFVVLSGSRRGGLALPTAILTTGFTADVITHAAMWWIVLFGIATARRRSRRARKQLCPHCAYDLSATPLDRPCPECGRSRLSVGPEGRRAKSRLPTTEVVGKARAPRRRGPGVRWRRASGGSPMVRPGGEATADPVSCPGMTAPTPSDQPITKTQRRALLAAWLGWAFDGLDGYLYILVAVPFVAKLMQTTAGDPAVARNAALIQAVFLVGWAVGGAVFGRIGDRLGRSRTLTLTILTYACFTGLTFFATEWWHLLIFRFIAALGIGGEWAAGSSLVSESLPARHRAWASATLQSGYMIGMIAAALSTNWISGLTGGDYRWVFVIGVIPAFATLWIRAAVPESDEWHAAKATQRTPPISALFSHELRRTTILLILLTGIALTTVWAFIYFSTQAIRAMPEVQGWKGTEVTALVTRVTIFFLIINIVGNFVATYLAKAVGYRAAFAILFAGSLACFLVGFRHPLSLDNVYWVTGACAITALGLFGLFPLYIPPLFPTLVRTLGAGVTYNAGRLISAAGTLGAGWLAAQAGGPTDALWYIGLLYVPGIVIALMAPVPVSVTGRSRR